MPSLSNPLPERLGPLHKRYVYPVDPAGFVLRYTLRTFLAVAAAIMASHWLAPDQILWFVATAVAAMFARGGSTMRARRRLMAAMVLGAALLAPLAGLAGQYLGWGTAMAFLIAFLGAGVAAWGPTAMAAGFWAMILSYISLGHPCTLDQTVVHCLAMLGGGACAFVVNFIIWPVRFRASLGRVAAVTLTDLADFARMVVHGRSRTTLLPQHDRVRASLRNIHRLADTIAAESHGRAPGLAAANEVSSRLVGMFEAMVSCARQMAQPHGGWLDTWSHARAREVLAIAAERIDALARAARRGIPATDFRRLEPLTDALERQLLARAKAEQARSADGMPPRHEWVRAMQLIWSLQSLARETQLVAARLQELRT